MKYKLLKKLKEAGFPQYLENEDWTEGGEGYWVDEEKNYFRGDSQGCIWQDFKGELVYEPTLEELIHACDPEKNSFRLGYGGVWRASVEKDFDFKNKQFIQHQADGETPVEAVAKLWIKLNEKYE